MTFLARVFVAAFVAALPLGAARAQPSTVILVRHAEKAVAPSDDPALTESGSQRALDLAATLAGARVNALFTTHLQRTQLTARPLAESLGLAPIVLRAGGPVTAHAAAVASAVRARPAGDVVLVVGHSNTIPAIIAALGGPKLPDLCDNQYATLFIMEFPAAGPPRLIRARFGAADPPDAESCSRTMR